MLDTPEEIAARRHLEDILRRCGDERTWLKYKDEVNRNMVRALLPQARGCGIKLAEISRLSKLSTQTLHAWMSENMIPVPMAHYGLQWPRANTLEEAALRTISQDPARSWTPAEVQRAIPVDWPTGTVADVAQALEILARSRQIWDAGSNDAYQLAPPAIDGE